jgi:hypothetical protein
LARSRVSSHLRSRHRARSVFPLSLIWRFFFLSSRICFLSASIACAERGAPAEIDSCPRRERDHDCQSGAQRWARARDHHPQQGSARMGCQPRRLSRQSARRLHHWSQVRGDDLSTLSTNLEMVAMGKGQWLAGAASRTSSGRETPEAPVVKSPARNGPVFQLARRLWSLSRAAARCESQRNQPV